MKKHTVLLVDDEIKILKSLNRLLCKKPYNLLFAESAKEALDLLKSKTVHIVVTDLKMPEMDGLSLLKEIECINPHIIRLLMSARYDQNSMLLAINERNIYRYINKPWNNTEVQIIIQQAVDLFNIHQEKRDLHKKLEKHNKLLKQRVEERTADLTEANRELERQIAERKQMEAVMENLIQQKELFFTRLGHDLKTPLTPLVGLLPLIRKQEKDPKIQNLLDACVLNVNYLKCLLIKAIKLARANSAAREISIENIPLMLKVKEYIEKNDFFIKEKGINFKNNISPAIKVRANEADLEELFYNFISNAVKYTPENGTVTFDAKAGNEMVTVSVKDNGIGLSNKHIARIFTEFYKVDESRHELGSSGLGLSICQKIVSNHGGKIWAKSPGKGRGTTFYFTISGEMSTVRRMDHELSCHDSR